MLILNDSVIVNMDNPDVEARFIDMIEKMPTAWLKNYYAILRGKEYEYGFLQEAESHRMDAKDLDNLIQYQLDCMIMVLRIIKELYNRNVDMDKLDSMVLM